MSAGPIAQRADVPEWFLNNSLWMNSGWECRDVFNETQSDPDVLLPRAKAIKCDYYGVWGFYFHKLKCTII